MSARAVRIAVALSAGEAEVSGLWAEVADARATVALAHGAGAGMDHPFLEGLASALVYLGYPLHPPGRPDKPRADHLPAITVPQLFVEGQNDPFIAPREQFDAVVATCLDARVQWVEGANHSFEVKGARRPAEEIGAGLAGAVGEFVAGL